MLAILSQFYGARWKPLPSIPKGDKYQLSVIDPRDGIMLQTELDDHRDKLAVDGRSSEVLST